MMITYHVLLFCLQASVNHGSPVAKFRTACASILMMTNNISLWLARQIKRLFV